MRNTISANSGQGQQTNGSMARMMTRTLVAAVAVSAALGGLVFSASEAKAPAPQHCKVLSAQTQTRAVTRPTPGTYTSLSDPTGTQERTATTSKCRGKLTVTYTAWH